MPGLLVQEFVEQIVLRVISFRLRKMVLQRNAGSGEQRTSSREYSGSTRVNDNPLQIHLGIPIFFEGECSANPNNESISHRNASYGFS